MIADEPTTALDVTIQAQVLELLRRLTEESGTALILITHDLGVVAGMTDRINVMYAGFIVETATTDDLFANPSHPYTVGLLHSIPRIDERRAAEPLDPDRGPPPDMRRAADGLSVRAALRLAARGVLDRQPGARPDPSRASGSSRPVRARPTGSPATTRRRAEEAAAGRPLRDGFVAAPPPPARTRCPTRSSTRRRSSAIEAAIMTGDLGPVSPAPSAAGLPLPPEEPR